MSLKNFQYNRILREYDSRQLKAKYTLDQKYNEIYHAIPEMEQLESEIVTASISHAKLALHGDEHASKDLENTLALFSKKRIELLTKHCYPADYLMPVYRCSACQDTGYIGKEKCHCFKQSIVELLYAQSNLKTILKKENFESFRFDYYPDNYVEGSTGLTPLDNIKKVVQTCKLFAQTFPHNYTNLFIYGNTGVGKTFLTNCLAKALLDRSHTVIYLTSFQLFDILEKYKFGKDYRSEENGEQFQYIMNCDLLILDDLGTELNNSFTSSQLYLCINERHLNQKSTIISTNLSFDDVSKHYSERIFSRITSNYILLKITGDDIRIKKTFL